MLTLPCVRQIAALTPAQSVLMMELAGQAHSRLLMLLTASHPVTADLSAHDHSCGLLLHFGSTQGLARLTKN